jgi:hypothetical protein
MPADPERCRIERRRVEVQCFPDNECLVTESIRIDPASGCPGGLAIHPRNISPGAESRHTMVVEPDGPELSPVACPENIQHPQGRLCHPPLPAGAEVTVLHRVWASQWSGTQPLVVPVLSAKHPFLGESAAASIGGFNLRLPSDGDGSLELQASGSFRFEYRLICWNRKAAVRYQAPSDFHLDYAGQMTVARKRGNPVGWTIQEGYEHAAVEYRKAPWGFAGLTVEAGAAVADSEWTGIGRLGADVSLLGFLYGTLMVEGSTDGGLALAAETVAATPNLLLLVPSFGLGLGVVGDFQPERAFSVRTRIHLQWPVAGIALGFDWRLSPSYRSRFHLALVLGF